MLTFNVILGVPEPPIPRLLMNFFLGFFFPSDRPTQHQETHSTLNEKKGGDGLMVPLCPYQRDLTTSKRTDQLSAYYVPMLCLQKGVAVSLMSGKKRT